MPAPSATRTWKPAHPRKDARLDFIEGYGRQFNMRMPLTGDDVKDATVADILLGPWPMTIEDSMIARVAFCQMTDKLIGAVKKANVIEVDKDTGAAKTVVLTKDMLQPPVGPRDCSVAVFGSSPTLAHADLPLPFDKFDAQMLPQNVMEHIVNGKIGTNVAAFYALPIIVTAADKKHDFEAYRDSLFKKFGAEFENIIKDWVKWCLNHFKPKLLFTFGPAPCHDFITCASFVEFIVLADIEVVPGTGDKPAQVGLVREKAGGPIKTMAVWVNDPRNPMWTAEQNLVFLRVVSNASSLMLAAAHVEAKTTLFTALTLPR